MKTIRITSIFYFRYIYNKISIFIIGYQSITVACRSHVINALLSYENNQSMKSYRCRASDRTASLNRYLRNSVSSFFHGMFIFYRYNTVTFVSRLHRVAENSYTTRSLEIVQDALNVNGSLK